MNMDWIRKAANERDMERHRQETIERGAPTLWENITRAIEKAFVCYAGLEGQLPVEFSGRANRTIWVAVFQQKQRPVGPERERVSITFQEESHTVEVRSSLDEAPTIFRMDLNGAGHVCLMVEKREVPVEEFTEMALRRAFFPPGK